MSKGDIGEADLREVNRARPWRTLRVIERILGFLNEMGRIWKFLSRVTLSPLPFKEITLLLGKTFFTGQEWKQECELRNYCCRTRERRLVVWTRMLTVEVRRNSWIQGILKV